MKLKLSQLKPNPFKKQINKGKLDNDQIKRLKSNIKELGLMGSIPVRKTDDGYEAISHHHRIQALKEVHGKDYEVEVNIKGYDYEQMMRGMFVENITQRIDDFKEVNENLQMVQNELKSGRILSVQTPDRKSTGGRPKGSIEAGSIRDVERWVNKNGELLKKSQIAMHLQINNNLAPELKAKIEKTHTGDTSKRTDENVLGQTQADYLSSFEDKKEQKYLFKALKKTKEPRVREQGKLLSKYKKADAKLKKRIREGKTDLAIFSDSDLNLPQTKKDEKLKAVVGINTGIDLSRNKNNIEEHLQLRQKIKELLSNPDFLKKSQIVELEETYHYIINWMKGDLLSFLKEIETLIKQKDEQSQIKCYDIIEKGG